MNRRNFADRWALLACMAALQASLLVGGCSVDRNASQQGASPSTTLFDGASLAGWDGDPRYWRVEDGLLTGETTAAEPLTRNTFLLCRSAIVGDFVLEFDYVVRSEWANSGVQYRSVEWPAANDGERWIVGGYQADIDEPVTYTGILYGERDRGILALRGQRVEIEPGGRPRVDDPIGDGAELAKAIRGKGEWNHYRIEAKGNRIMHAINGITMIDVIDNDAIAAVHDQRGARRSGLIALQLHTGQPMKIQFRNIELASTGPHATR